MIDKRPVGRLWVIDGDPPSSALAAFRARGVRSVFARDGGRSTDRRPARFTRKPPVGARALTQPSCRIGR